MSCALPNLPLPTDQVSRKADSDGPHPAGPVTSQACRSIRTRTFDRENTDPDEGDITHSTVGNRTMLDPKAAAPDKPCRVYYGPSGLTFTG
jgi:hypothetical protein